MNSRERILTTLEHREPDRVPYDLSGTHVSGIHITACKELCKALGLQDVMLQYTDEVQQVVRPPQALMDAFEIDTYGLFPLCSHNWNIQSKINGEYYEHIDEWGFLHQKPIENGYWWSLRGSPLAAGDLTKEMIKDFNWPKPALKERLVNLREQAVQARKNKKIVLMKGLCAGIFEMGQRVRGMENFLCDLLAEPEMASLLLDKILELKLEFWQMAINELGDLVDIIVETDDYGTQESQLISQDTYRELVEPRLKTLVQTTKKWLNAKKPLNEKGYFFFHSCGSIRPFLPSFIEMGIDILNPVHIAAANMDPFELKKSFGKEITFWGGGVETQFVLPKGTRKQIRENVKRNLDALMPNGGFVFNTVHNIMSEVPAENIITMREALKEFGVYSNKTT